MVDVVVGGFFSGLFIGAVVKILIWTLAPSGRRGV